MLFDLDGTLTNSKEGITKSVQYALQSLGIQEDDLDKLECYIGPALKDSFQMFHKLNAEQTSAAVRKYRERYTDTGLFENAVYDGMEECLKKMKEAGKVIALATCKPEPFAVRILEHFNLTQYFDVIVGSEMNETRTHKNEVIDEVFHRIMTDESLATAIEKDAGQSDALVLEQMKADSIMIGDRNQDINGAKTCRIESVGVRFGFAEEGELEEAGADYIVETAQELTELLLTL